MGAMFAFPVMEAIAAICAMVIYSKMSAKDKSDLWRKASCYCGAVAVGIETTEAKYEEYKTQMGLTEVKV